MNMIIADKIVGIVGIVASLVAAIILLRASFIEVPDNIDTFIGELQRIGLWSSAGCFAAFMAAVCGAYVFCRALWR
jgi:hypothetical protein